MKNYVGALKVSKQVECACCHKKITKTTKYKVIQGNQADAIAEVQPKINKWHARMDNQRHYCAGADCVDIKKSIAGIVDSIKKMGEQDSRKMLDYLKDDTNLVAEICIPEIKNRLNELNESLTDEA
jgi:hypothetical protein